MSRVLSIPSSSNRSMSYSPPLSSRPGCGRGLGNSAKRELLPRVESARDAQRRQQRIREGSSELLRASAGCRAHDRLRTGIPESGSRIGSRAGRPPFDSFRRPRYDPRVSETRPPPGLRKRPPTLEHVRDLWTLHSSQSNCTAAIWRNDFGLELRVKHGGRVS